MSAVLTPPHNAVSGARALEIAESDASRVYHNLLKYDIRLNLEPDGWHVDYELRERRHGGGPHYVIDASTGAITTKRYEQ